MNTPAAIQKIVCVIPTRNRLPMLMAAIQAVEAQTRRPDHIVVVDNNSTDGTADWLAGGARNRDDVKVIRLPENRGGAGGYHFGIRQAYDIGADWIWTLDDDSVPEPSALSALLDAAARLPDSGFLASAVLWTDGSPHVMNQPHFVGRDDSDTPAIRSASFVSILINRTAIATVGYPIRQFFIHYDDMEYTRRITTAGFPAFLVKASRATHATVSNAGVTLRNMRSIRPEQRTEWEYTIRNLVAVNRRRPFGWLREPMRLCVLAARLLVSATPPAIGAAIVKAGLKGLFMRYEKRIEYPKKMKSSE